MAPGTIDDRVMSALCILFDLKPLWLSDLEGIRSWSEGLHLALCNLAGNRVRPNLRLDGDTLKGDHWASVPQNSAEVTPPPKNGLTSGSTNARVRRVRWVQSTAPQKKGSFKNGFESCHGAVNHARIGGVDVSRVVAVAPGVAAPAGAVVHSKSDWIEYLFDCACANRGREGQARSRRAQAEPRGLTLVNA